MYLDHFGLHEAPFKITPHTDFFYQGANRGAILEGLLYAIQNGEGLIKVVGEVGVGKTMLSRVCIDKLPGKVQSILITTPSISPEEMLLTIAEELGLNISGQRHTNIVRSLQECLIEKYANGMQVVVFIDEAHAMPRETLEEIRLLSNLESSRHKLLQIVLFGQPELDQLLARPEMRQLRERITHSFNLSPLIETDISQYLSFRMRAAGYKGPDVFTAKAIKTLGRASKGLTRRINILADKSLLAAFAENTHGVTQKHVDAAIDDSEFRRDSKAFTAVGKTIGAIVAMTMAAGAGYMLAARPLAASPLTDAAPTSTTMAEPQAGSAADSASEGKAQARPSNRQGNLTMARLDAGKALLETSKNASTIQLMLADPPPSQTLERFLAQMPRPLLESIYIYPTSTGNSKRLVVIYGTYQNKEETKQAMNALPTELKRNAPIVRTLKGIREEIAATMGQ
jgi:type II secretory pathway predicted ATPase ExeA